MKLQTLSISGVLAMLVACNSQSPDRPNLTGRSASIAQPASVEKIAAPVEEVFTPESIAAMQAEVASAPVAEAPSMSMDDMRQQVQASFASSNLSPADSEAMNADVQALIGAAEAQNFVQVSMLANGLVAKAAGLQGLNLPGFGLVDIAGALAAVQALAAAALGLDIAGVLAAVQALIAAIGA